MTEADIVSWGANSNTSEEESEEENYKQESESFKISLQMTKFAANAFIEQNRKGDPSPTRYLQFSNVKVAH